MLAHFKTRFDFNSVGKLADILKGLWGADRHVNGLQQTVFLIASSLKFDFRNSVHSVVFNSASDEWHAIRS
jgi:hypothetical protein